MYSLKLAHLVRESTGARVYEVYKDLRAFGKGYEEFYTRVEEEGDVGPEPEGQPRDGVGAESIGKGGGQGPENGAGVAGSAAEASRRRYPLGDSDVHGGREPRALEKGAGGLHRQVSIVRGADFTCMGERTPSIST